MKKKLNKENLEWLISKLSTSFRGRNFDLYVNQPDRSKRKSRPVNDYEPNPVVVVGKDAMSDSDRLYYFDKNSYNNLFGGFSLDAKTITQQADCYEFIFMGVDEDNNPFNTPSAIVHRMEMILDFYIEHDDLPNAKELEMLRSYNNQFVFRQEMIPFEPVKDVVPLPQIMSDDLKSMQEEIDKLTKMGKMFDEKAEQDKSPEQKSDVEEPFLVTSDVEEPIDK